MVKKFVKKILMFFLMSEVIVGPFKNNCFPVKIIGLKNLMRDFFLFFFQRVSQRWCGKKRYMGMKVTYFQPT